MLLPALPLASCATLGRAPSPIPGNGCDWDAAIYVSGQDMLTDGTAKAILQHNVTGAKICGWKPTSPSSAGSSPPRSRTN